MKVEEPLTSLCPSPATSETKATSLILSTSLHLLTIYRKNCQSNTSNPLCVEALCSHLFVCPGGVDLVFLTAYLQYKPASSSVLLFRPPLPTAYLYCPRLTPRQPSTHSRFTVLVHHWSVLWSVCVCVWSPGIRVVECERLQLSIKTESRWGGSMLRGLDNDSPLKSFTLSYVRYELPLNVC